MACDDECSRSISSSSTSADAATAAAANHADGDQQVADLNVAGGRDLVATNNGNIVGLAARKKRTLPFEEKKKKKRGFFFFTGCSG